MFEKRTDLIKFLAVVDTGKIHAAAAKLNTTQPALSRIIAKLEDQFKGQLFERVPTGVRLTAFGATIEEQARHILREIELAEDEINSTVSGRTGHLRITAGPMWMQVILPSVIRRFHETYPGITLQLATMSYQEGVDLLTNGHSDLHCGGFDSDEPLPQFLNRDHILDMDLGVVAHEDHPLLARPIITYDDLVDYPWLGYGAQASTTTRNDWPSLTNILDELAERTGRRVRTIVQIDAAGLFLMRTGPYLSYFSLNFAQDIPGLPLRIIPLNFKSRSFRSGIVARRSIKGTSAFKHFNELLREKVAAYLP